MDWFDVMRRLEDEDRLAFDELCKLVRNQIMRMRGRTPIELADDVAQEILISVLRAWRAGRIREEHCFPGFVRTLAERRLADAWNRHVRPGAADSMGDPEQSLGSCVAISRREHRECAIDVTRALRRLDHSDRLVLSAIYLEGRTYAETAACMGLPLGTFKRKLGDSLRRMRAELA
jgi:RNA polymerase sigma-70 factor, ECF subfamily